MKERWFRRIALVIGLLGIPSVVSQVVRGWPPGGLQLQFLGLQAIVVGVFVAYGLGLAFRTSSDKSAEPPLESDVDS